MGIYYGRGGVVTELAGAPHAGIGGVARHVLNGEAGVDGVARPFLDPVEELDHVELRLSFCEAYDAQKDPNDSYAELQSNWVEGLAAVNAVGSITVGEDRVEARCGTRGKGIYCYGYFYAVFSDGHRVRLNTLTGLGLTVSVNVTYYIGGSGSGGGWWNWWLFSKRPVENVSRPVSGTIDVACGSDDSMDLGASSLGSTMTSRQIYNSAAIGGKSVPVAVVNGLT